SDFFQHSFLRGRGMKWQNFFNSLAHGVIKAECDPGLGFLLPAFEFESEFDKKEFLEDQANMRRRAGGLQILEALAGLRPVEFPNGVSWRNKAEVPSNYGRNRIRQLRRQVFERCVDNATKPTRGEPPLAGCLVNWDNPANFQRSCGFLFGAI